MVNEKVTIERVIEELREVLALKGLSVEQQERALDNIAKAIFVNALGRLGNQLPNAEKEQIKAKGPDTTEQLMAELELRIGKDKAEILLASSTKEVIENFLEKIFSRA